MFLNTYFFCFIFFLLFRIVFFKNKTKKTKREKYTPFIFMVLFMVLFTVNNTAVLCMEELPSTSTPQNRIYNCYTSKGVFTHTSECLEGKDRIYLPSYLLFEARDKATLSNNHKAALRLHKAGISVHYKCYLHEQGFYSLVVWSMVMWFVVAIITAIFVD